MRSDNKRPQEQLKPLSLPNILEEIECVNEYWRELMEGASSAVKAFSHDLGRSGLTRQYPDELLNPPAIRLRDEMRNLVGPAESFYEHWHEITERNSSAVKEFSRDLERSGLTGQYPDELRHLSAMHSVDDEMRNLVSPSESFNEYWRELMEGASSAVKAFSRDFEQAQLAGKRLDELLNPPAMRSLRDVMSSLDHRIKSIKNHMEVTPEGAISLGNDVLLIGEVEGAIEDFFSQIPEIDFSERFWECFWERFQHLNDIVKSIIIYFLDKILVAIIVSIVANMASSTIKDYINPYLVSAAFLCESVFQ